MVHGRRLFESAATVIEVAETQLDAVTALSGSGPAYIFFLVEQMIAAGTAGILSPLTLDRFKIDPAVASSTFVTTVTDVVGFFAFLGLASLWFDLG